MSKDKYPSIFSSQMATIVFIILQIFFATRAVLKIGEYLTTIHWSGGGWLALDIYLAASRLGKYPPLATSISVNSC